MVIELVNLFLYLRKNHNWLSLDVLCYGRLYETIDLLKPKLIVYGYTKINGIDYGDFFTF